MDGSADESDEWRVEDTEELASEEYFTTVMGEEAARRQLTATARGSVEKDADGKHGGAAAGGGNTGNTSLRPPTRQEREAIMGQEPRLGRGFLAGGITQQASPMEWEEKGRAARPTDWQVSPTVWGDKEEAVRPTEWRKTLGGTVREWEGESSCRRASTLPERKHCPRGTKPQEWTLRATE